MILSGTWEHRTEYTATMRKWRPAKSGRTSYGNIRLENPIQSHTIRNKTQPRGELEPLAKDLMRRILDRSGAPAYLWYRAMVDAGGLLNVTVQQNLSWRTPTEVTFGETPDISAYLQFTFYQRVLHLDPTASFPRNKELPGRFVGVAENTGDALTFYILRDHTNQIIARSVVRPVSDDPMAANQRVKHEIEPKSEPRTTQCPNEPPTTIDLLNETLKQAALIIQPTDLTGYTFVDTLDGTIQKATVIERTDDDTDQWLVQYLHGGRKLSLTMKSSN